MARQRSTTQRSTTPSRGARGTFSAATLTLALTGMLGGCTTGPGTSGAGNTAADQDVCVAVDAPYYPTSRDLQNAADATVRGTIVSIDPGDFESGPQWVVGFQAEDSTGPAATQAVGAITIRLPKLCGDTPFGGTFAVGSPFIMLLSGPRDGAFYPVNTTQGLIPVVDGQATPLNSVTGSDVTISNALAQTLGAPLRTADDTTQNTDGQNTTTQNADSLTPAAGAWAPGIPEFFLPLPDATDVRAGAAWAGGVHQGLLYIFTWGSSSCPDIAEPQATGDASGITVTLRTPAEVTSCTFDLAPTTSFVAVPDGVDNGAPLSVRLGDLGTVIVQPRGSQFGDLHPPGASGLVGPAAWLS
jgi:hypothetical protein